MNPELKNSEPLQDLWSELTAGTDSWDLPCADTSSGRASKSRRMNHMITRLRAEKDKQRSFIPTLFQVTAHLPAYPLTRLLWNFPLGSLSVFSSARCEPPCSSPRLLLPCMRVHVHVSTMALTPGSQLPFSPLGLPIQGPVALLHRGSRAPHLRWNQRRSSAELLLFVSVRTADFQTGFFLIVLKLLRQTAETLAGRPVLSQHLSRLLWAAAGSSHNLLGQLVMAILVGHGGKNKKE